MLHAFAKHSGCGLQIRARGDGMDNHHVIEDAGIALGKAIAQALGEKRGIARYGSVMVPLDEALIAAAIDISGRPFLNFRVTFLRDDLGQMPTEMIGEFFRAVTDNAKITLHLVQMNGHVAHHVCEAAFKAFARAFAAAKCLTGEESVPSTKGLLE
jgi:imidazoleglycerol-phosphate dehydratase